MVTKTSRYSLLKPQAINLRKKGKTFSEIKNLLGDIPKSTLSNWLKDITLTGEQTERIRKLMKENGSLGRHMGAQRNHQLRIERLAGIRIAAIDEYNKLVKEPIFLPGLVLYLAEGSKKAEQFQFMNSDPKLMKYMVLWTTKCGRIEIGSLRFRLYIHEQYMDENCVGFWLKELGVESKQFLKTIYKPSVRVYKKNPQYKGCMRLEVGGSELYWKVMAWRDCFYSEVQ